MSDPASVGRRPRAVRLKPEPLPGFEDRAPPVGSPSVRARSDLPVEMMPDPFVIEALAIEPDEEAVEIAQRRGIAQRSLLSWAGLFWTALCGLISLAIGLWITQVIESALSRAPALGAIGIGLVVIILVALAVLGAREITAIGRQRHIATMHSGFARAHAGDDTEEARKLIAELEKLYGTRPETARARKEISDLRQQIVDGRDLIEIAERALVAPIDDKAKAAIAGAAKRVSVVTTVAPRAIVDIAFVLIQAVRLIRQISEFYGGRPGVLGFVKLARSVGAHLAITGGMAAGDSLLQQVVGHGIAAKVSARLGEGVLNGLLTARIGMSAMAVCRPMPFSAQPAPALRSVVPFLFRSNKDRADSETV